MMSQVKLKSERLIISCKTMWETYNGFWLGATILKAMKHQTFFAKKKIKETQTARTLRPQVSSLGNNNSEGRRVLLDVDKDKDKFENC